MAWGFLTKADLLLWLQSGMMGFVAGEAFPGFVWQFWAILIANTLLTMLYSAAKKDNQYVD